MYPLALDLGDGLGQRGFALPAFLAAAHHEP